jgi:hypothetical protein
MIVRFLLPESFAGTAQNRVGMPSRGPLQPPSDYRQRLFRQDEYVNMIGHNDPSPEFVEVSLPVASNKRLRDKASDTTVPKPQRPSVGTITLAIGGSKASSLGLVLTRDDLPGRKGAPQSPGYKDKCIFRMPVRETAFVIHKLAGETACATIQWDDPNILLRLVAQAVSPASNRSTILLRETD